MTGKTRDNKPPRRSLRELLGDRALMVGLLFSVTVHLVVFFHVPWPSAGPSPPPRRFMIARLVRPAAPPPAVGETAPAPEVPVGEGAEPAPAAPPLAEPLDGPQQVTVGASGTTAVRTARATGHAALSLRSFVSLRRAEAPRLPASDADGKARLSILRQSSPGETLQPALAEIRRMIESRKSYPRLARRNGWEGRVLVELSLAAGGTLQDVQIVTASGYRILDNATVRAVRSAGPFPPVEGRVQVPVSYRLEE